MVVMVDRVYRVTEVIGVSTESWEAAARSAVDAARPSRDLRIAEVIRQDVAIENGAIRTIASGCAISFSTSQRLSRRLPQEARSDPPSHGGRAPRLGGEAGRGGVQSTGRASISRASGSSLRARPRAPIRCEGVWRHREERANTIRVGRKGRTADCPLLGAWSIKDSGLRARRYEEHRRKVLADCCGCARRGRRCAVGQHWPNRRSSRSRVRAAEASRATRRPPSAVWPRRAANSRSRSTAARPPPARRCRR